MSKKKAKFRIIESKDYAAAMHEWLVVKANDDRATVLIGVSMLEDCLLQFIRSRVTEKKVFEWLFDLGRPLGTFSARIKCNRSRPGVAGTANWPSRIRQNKRHPWHVAAADYARTDRRFAA